MKLRTMALTRMDELQAWADVDLDVTGDDRAAKIVGEVTVNRGEVDLAVALPASVPQLEVANLAQPERQEKGEKDAPAAFAADLDVTVNIPSRLFVRGKGLDSEWGGRLEITGPAASPVLVGELRARRGQLDIIGKTFAIRDSKIAFVGGQPPEPLLGIVGVHKAGDLLVTASLSGPASSTKLTLSSNPDMPQDEILSRILFGKAQGNLSTLEALQLASAAAELSGEGGGLDVVGSFRRSLGADVLRVEGGEAGPNVEVGKYLTEGVYVGTKRGATPGSSGVEVEIELTPYLKVTSESNEVDNKAGVQFKWDY
jgi:translocation and assembly module TamB